MNLFKQVRAFFAR